MIRHTMQFAYQTKDGIVERIGKSFIFQPKTEYKGGGIKWYEDTVKKHDVKN